MASVARHVVLIAVAAASLAVAQVPPAEPDGMRDSIAIRGAAPASPRDARSLDQADGAGATQVEPPAPAVPIAAWLPREAITARTLLLLGAPLVGVLLALPLALRLRRAQHARERAQTEALTALRQRIATLGESERTLTERLAERSRELELARQALHEQERQLEHRANHDALTGLANQMLLEDRITHAIARARRHNTGLAVLRVDLDGFKPVNDTFGDAVGDALLVAIAARLRALVRGEDTVARLGADEFVLVLESVFDPDDVARVVGAVGHELAAPFTLGEQTAHIGASVGCAFFPSDGDDAATLLRAAAKMMRHDRARQQRAAPPHGSADTTAGASG